ncbi:MAG: ISAzo13 family transposase [Candidatus Solibacter sp.]|nr:ISAzo13 family transposase [Candidatus Solibacter sp.]
MAGEEGIQRRFEDLSPVLSEQGLRRFAATEARAYGHGGVSAVSRITGLARSTIGRGVREIEENLPVQTGRVRRPGGGRKAKQAEDSTLLSDLQRVVEPATRGDPMRTLQWTSKSLRRLSAALHEDGHSVCPHVIADCLRKLGYSLQANRKTQEGSGHMDRDAQFQYIDDQATAFLAAGEPVISVDTKKKELVGNFKNNGREWRPHASPEAVNVHDFIDPKLGRAIPYGVYDIGDNKGWVSVGTDHDTASFAVHAIHRWWLTMGRDRYPKATRLLVTADGGGSNGYRVRLWKIELQELANTLRLPITVCHLPPGTSKWNKIEHRLFSFITINWRGKPLRSFKTVVQLIAATTTTTGLTVRAELDEGKYPKGIKISDAKLAAINLARHPFHGDWNYTIAPQPT